MKYHVCIVLLLLLFSCAKAPEQVEKPSLPVKEKTAEPVAVLAVQSGLALVNGSPASPGLELREGDLVSTSAGAKASIVFFDSAVLRLDENTEIEVKSIVKGESKAVSVRQFTGSTWSRILKVSGIKEYSVETPNTVATVRGTGFGVTVSDGDSEIKVTDGSVHVASLKDGEIVAKAVVNENFEVTVTDEAPAEIELEALESDAWIEENEQYDEEFIEEVVAEYVEEHPEAVEGMSEEQAEEYAEEIVMGEEYVEEVVSEIVEEQPVEETPVKEQPVEEIPAEEVPDDRDTTGEELPIDEKIIDETKEPSMHDVTGANTVYV